MSQEQEQPQHEKEEEKFDYDIVVLGTGLNECILSGLMSSVAHKRVFHMDRNDYYGGESASLNIQQLFEKFKGPDAKIPDVVQGRYSVDLCPKFLMAGGDLVKVLLHTKVTQYLNFRSVGGSYCVYKNKVHKVPATASEGLSSGLLGMMQKVYYRSFINFIHSYDENDTKTHQGQNVNVKTMQEIYDYFKLDQTTQTFTSHALALQVDDTHRSRPAKETIERIKLYANSVLRFGNSPYIYPLWGLGGLPESFSRLSSIHGGIYMLNANILGFNYGDDGKISGVRFSHESTGEKVATCKTLISDPSYLSQTNKVKKTGQIARCIALMSHPIPNTNDDSCQIIIPNTETKGRQSDMYLSCVSYHHQVAPQGKYVAVASARVEGGEADTKDLKSMADVAERELKYAVGLMGQTDQLLFWVTDYYVPQTDGSADGVFITSSVDEQSHFESATDEVLKMYKSLTGQDLDLTVIETADPEKLQGEGA